MSYMRFFSRLNRQVWLGASVAVAALFLLTAPQAALAQASPQPGGLINLGVPDADLGKLIDENLAPLIRLLPPDQQRLAGPFKEFIKSTINTYIPPEVFREQVENLKQIERDLGGPQPPSAYRLTIETDTPSPFPGRPVGVYANVNFSLGGETPDVTQTGLAFFEWWLDGRPVLQGLGQNYFAFTSNGAGFIHSLRVRARLASGRILQAVRLMPVVDADVVWYADTYVPPGYRGKRLASPSSFITVAVVPTVPGTLGPFRYLWTIDDLPVTTAAVGRDTLTLPAAGGDRYVQVRIVDLRGTVDFSKTVAIGTVSPQVVFHDVRSGKHDVGTRAGGAFTLSPASQKSVLARPYFFSAAVLQGLRFRWIFDQSELPEVPRSPDLFTVNIASARLAPGTSVQKPLRLIVENRDPRAFDEIRSLDTTLTIQ